MAFRLMDTGRGVDEFLSGQKTIDKIDEIDEIDEIVCSRSDDIIVRMQSLVLLSPQGHLPDS